MTEQPLSLRTAATVYVSLLMLVALTVWAAHQDVGRWNLAVALLIAAAKTVLILWFFMHVRYSSALIRLVIGAALGLAAMGLILSLADYWTRAWL